jgi:hypothetical protein
MRPAETPRLCGSKRYTMTEKLFQNDLGKIGCATGNYMLSIPRVGRIRGARLDEAVQVHVLDDC